MFWKLSRLMILLMFYILYVFHHISSSPFFLKSAGSRPQSKFAKGIKLQCCRMVPRVCCVCNILFIYSHLPVYIVIASAAWDALLIVVLIIFNEIFWCRLWDMEALKLFNDHSDLLYNFLIWYMYLNLVYSMHIQRLVVIHCQGGDNS